MSDQITNGGWTRAEIAKRAAIDIEHGSYVNLGIGIPERIAGFIPDDRQIIIHTENGLLGMGPEPDEHDIDRELINAGKKHVTTVPGASFFHHADSFAMIRGGHLDLSVLGALEVSASGDLANWSTGGSAAIPAVGGAMDLISGVKKVFVLTSHCTRDGAAKLVETCNYPLTGKQVVDRVYTNLAVIDVKPNGFNLIEVAPGVSFDMVARHTNAELHDKRAR